MCSTVASSPILAVQLAERALTACNYPQNHLLALFVDVIGSATCAGQFLQIPCGFLYVPVVAYSELRAGIASLVQYCKTSPTAQIVLQLFRGYHPRVDLLQAHAASSLARVAQAEDHSHPH